MNAPALPAFESRLGGCRLLFGAGTLARLGECARELGGSRVLLVTDPGVQAAGHAGAAAAALETAGLEATLFAGVEENPTSRHVQEGVECARVARADLLVGLGGGSAMDCAKGINFLLTNGGRMEDYQGRGRAARPFRPSIGIPTTAGTGSEAQSFALIARQDSHSKMACGDEKARFRTVILDPALTASMPRRVTARSGLDAIGHAVESYVTRHANPLSRLLAQEAWRLLEGSLERVLEAAGDPAARGRMLWGAHLAGAAIERSMLGAAHACANPLTARFGLAHGEAVALMLPHVVRFNRPAVEPLYRELAAVSTNGSGPVDRRIAALRAAAGLPARLQELQIPRAALPELARAAAREWTASHNPRPAGAAELLDLYESAY
ncbi:MAG: iron-containing alcohol dehydrogenase [Acidobacteriota bacterium]